MDGSTTPRNTPGKDEEHAGTFSLSTMESLNGPFTGANLNFRLPCTATEDSTCRIFGHLSAWNEFVSLASWQLHEMPGNSGQLSLAVFRYGCQGHCSPQELRLATLLVCHLLKTHRCIAHIELDISLFKLHHQLLTDALRETPSITNVKLVLSYEVSAEDFATAVLCLPHLKELEYAGYMHHSPTLVARLSAVLRTTTSLTALRVSEGYTSGLSSEEFFRGLAQNCSLKELVLPSSLISEAPPSAQAAFTEWLTDSISLTSLTVDSSLFTEQVSLKSILYALLKNRSIIAANIACPKGDDPAVVPLLSKIFEQNKVLRRLEISYVSPLRRGRPDKVDCDHCLKALIENHTLEKVSLPIDIWDEDQWTELFEALPAKKNLKRVGIQKYSRESIFFPAKLCAALRETGADEKVSFDAFIKEQECDEKIECKAFSCLFVQATDDNTGAVYRLLDRMPSLGHITDFTLVLTNIDEELYGQTFPTLTTFLAATRMLKTLSLCAFLDTSLYICQEALMKGLAANTSLREVEICVFETTSDISVFSEPLADVILASRNISRVHFEVNEPEDGRGDRTFFERLSAGIADNYTLLKVGVPGGRYKEFERSWFEAWNVTRRNNNLLTRAADFARGVRRDGRCALALERMQGHPELVDEVARLEGVDQAQAATMVKDSLRSIEWMDVHEFMRLAGVVRERVSCRAREDGRTHLVALNEHCWIALRRYVKLYHVKESTA